MKLAVLAILPLLTIAAPAVSQNSSASSAAPAGVVSAKFSLDTPIETLVADAKAKAVLDANMPGMTTHAAYDMFKTMSLSQVAPMAPDKMTPALLDKVRTELAVIR